MRDNFIVNELLSTKEKVFNHDWSKFKIISKEGHKCPIEINFPDQSLEGHLYLKHQLFYELEKKFNNKENEILIKDCSWIINDWGKIKLDLTKQQNKEIILNFLEKIYNNKVIFEQEEECRIISSLSKIASFCKPEKYAIYDSKAVMSLNWLLIKYAIKNSKVEDTLIFPQPPGVSKILKSSNLETLCNLSIYNFEKYKEIEKYDKYCELLKNLSNKMFEKLDTKSEFKNWPYLAEMFLFLYSDSKVGELEKDIKKSINVSFKF